MSDKAYGPHPAGVVDAVAAALATRRGTHTADARAALDAAYDPALEARDRSFNGGALVDAMQALLVDGERANLYALEFNDGVRAAIKVILG